MNTKVTKICVAVWAVAAAQFCSADSGVIIPSGSQTPDARQLTIDSLEIRVVIDNGHATVHFQEVFHNLTSHALEGTYLLALTGGAAISDFAIWDDVTRIPGVILERKRASELYEQIRNQAIDPGLLESGEVSDSEAPGQARHSNDFSVKIVPIPPYGYKRVEAEYRQAIPVTQLTGGFSIPLKPVTYEPQTARQLSIYFELRDSQSIAGFAVTGQAFPLAISMRNEHLIKGSFQGSNIAASQDFAVTYKLVGNPDPTVQAYRTGATGEPGFFEATAILADSSKSEPNTENARNIVVLLDTSLSMQWEKLERSFQALETTLRSLRPADKFNVILFNSVAQAANPQPVEASSEAVSKALEFVRASRLQRGTNLQEALKAAFAQSRPNTYIVLLSDGELTEGAISPARFETWLNQAWHSIPTERAPHLYSLAIGDDANIRLMRRIASHGGVFEQVGSTETLDFKLAGFLRKIGLSPLDRVELSIGPQVNPSLVYRLGQDNFPGSLASWVGHYGTPAAADFTVSTVPSGAAGHNAIHAQLPAVDTTHEYLPATWARARVNALLEKIDLEGEDKASIDEIIQLSRKYKFVTPYTSFLAAPRALLRPRLIRPGDPLLRVRTDPSIVSLIALFPFGPIKPLRFIKEENIWQTRFLAPDDLPDGTHTVRLILRDNAGHVYREQKTFVISSHAPVVRVRLESARVHAGDRLNLSVQTSETTRTITARLYGAPPILLRWSDAQKSNTGVLTVPAALPAGRYSIHVTAEDIAHNVSHQEVPLEVIP